MEYFQLTHLLLWALIASCWIIVYSQVPPRLNIPGAVPVPITRTVVTRARRPAAALRASQNLIQPHIVSHTIEDSKPVTESIEEDISEAYAPHGPQISQTHSHVQLREQLREQSLTSAQQAQFQQTVAAFLNGEVNAIPDSPITHLLDDDEAQLTHTTPQFSTRFPERQNIINIGSPSSKPIFNDYGIGANIINGGNGNGNSNGGQRYNSNDRVTNNPYTAPQDPQTRDRVSIIRSRPSVRESKPHYEAQSAPSIQTVQSVVSRPRVKSIQPRPLIEQNQLSDEREEQYNNKRSKRPVVAQTLRKWREEHEDGSITWGYENDDGSFKEEIIGVDCVTKGTYGYVDPDGNKREYHYETGIKCDPNKRTAEAEAFNNDGFVNYDENRAILPNGIEIDMSQLGKKKSRRPVANYKN